MMKSRTVRTVGRVARREACIINYIRAELYVSSHVFARSRVKYNFVPELQRVTMYGLQKYTGTKKKTPWKPKIELIYL